MVDRPHPLTPGQIGLALAAGLLLATLPFARYAHWGAAGAPHANHEAQFGGQLGMVGDHHIEVRRHGGQVEVFTSDAHRRLLAPAAGWVVFDRGEPRPLTWDAFRLTGADQPGAHDVAAIVVLADDTRLATSFDFFPSQ